MPVTGWVRDRWERVKLKPKGEDLRRLHDHQEKFVDPLLDLDEVDDDERYPIDPNNPENAELLDEIWSQAVDVDAYKVEIDELMALPPETRQALKEASEQ